MKRRLAVVTLLGVLPATVLGAMLGVGPAEAASNSPGPSIRHLEFRWVPGTGSVHADAVVTCAKGVTHASVTVELGQSGAGARASTKPRCDGRWHHIHLLLDPRRGRFQPGTTGVSWSAGGCRGNLCWMGVADGFTHIDRPGRARGPRGAR